MPDRHRERSPHPAVLWAGALGLALAAAAFQRWTGPTLPLNGWSVVEGRTMEWRLRRGGISGEPLRVEVAAPEGVLMGTLRWRPYPTEDRFQGLSMLREDANLVGLIPTQTPAAKVEYYVVLASRSGLVRIPETKPVIARFESEVPTVVFFPHAALMFASLLVGLRAGLGALFARPETLRLAWVTLGSLTVGGMMLGRVVQKFAADAFWAGWPLGDDLTDNTVLVAWLAWIVAVLALRGARSREDRFARTTVAVAAAVTLAIFVAPHSLGGSGFDYGRLEVGSLPQGAVTADH